VTLEQLAKLPSFLVPLVYPDTATLQTPSSSLDSIGAETVTYTTVGTCRAQLSAGSQLSEVRSGEGEFEVRERNLLLRGWHPEMVEGCRVIVGEHTYEVRGIAPDSWGVELDDEGWTPLIVEEREP
jgi:head-tail adaptor